MKNAFFFFFKFKMYVYRYIDIMVSNNRAFPLHVWVPAGIVDVIVIGRSSMKMKKNKLAANPIKSMGAVTRGGYHHQPTSLLYRCSLLLSIVTVERFIILNTNNGSSTSNSNSNHTLHSVGNNNIFFVSTGGKCIVSMEPLNIFHALL